MKRPRKRSWKRQENNLCPFPGDRALNWIKAKFGPVPPRPDKYLYQLRLLRWGLPFFLGLMMLLPPAAILAGEMRGPDGPGHPVSSGEPWESSPLKLGLQGVLWLYQRGVSPINPDRCGFRPSCSAYGSVAVREHGPFWGVLLTADRLLRCHYFKRPGPFTLLLPDGKILDLPPDKLHPENFEP
jgi:putative membrane protein insertion efficiency factor